MGALILGRIAPFRGSNRVKRGGSYGYPALGCRSADRDSNGARGRYDNVGVRVSLVLPDKLGKRAKPLLSPGVCPQRSRAGSGRGYPGHGGLGRNNTWKPNQKPNLRSIPFCVGGPKNRRKLGVFTGNWHRGSTEGRIVSES
jgi:hypothetical protein